MTRRALKELQTKAEWSTTIERLRRMALALTRSADDADDLTQQTLVTLLVAAILLWFGYGEARTLVQRSRAWLRESLAVAPRLPRMVLARSAAPVTRGSPADRLRVLDLAVIPRGHPRLHQ